MSRFFKLRWQYANRLDSARTNIIKASSLDEARTVLIKRYAQPGQLRHYGITIIKAEEIYESMSYQVRRES
jgi:type II secretory pathway component PulF